MLLIYTHTITNRLSYTFNLLFNNLFVCEYQLTDDKDFFKDFDGAKFSYTENHLASELLIKSHSLLFEDNIKPVDFSVETIDDLPCIFADEKNCLGFDPIAASFYLASRYEEYLPFEEDKYNRFTVNQSCAHKNGFHKKPIVHYYAFRLAQKIQEYFPKLVFKPTEYKAIPTLDIDFAYKYKHRGTKRFLSGLIGDALTPTFGFSGFFERPKSILGYINDPYDIYEWLDEVHGKVDLKPIYFFPTGDYDTYDKNHSYESIPLQHLIESRNEVGEVGLHPSYASSDKPEMFRVEKERLEFCTDDTITQSRQHFLRMRLPETYEHLIAAGITDDYTMGYANDTGFRASLCIPYQFYNLAKEEATNLTIHPFMLMDATYVYYNDKDKNEVWADIENLISEVRNVNGTFIPIAHNNLLVDEYWLTLYVDMLDLMATK